MADEKEVQMFIGGLVIDPASNAPIVILKDAEGGVCLPIWIGLAEATAIASSLKKVELARPMTHDLLQQTINELGGKVLKVFIRGLEENTFLADIHVEVGSAVKVLDARPSDALALAVRVECPITVSAEVLKHAQVTLVTENMPEVGEGEAEEGNQNFANIEKDRWADLLADMDPNDFKYKM